MKTLIKRLAQLGMRISVAESCTGGLLAKTITDTPGASGVFDMSVVTYSNESKQRLLSVSEETLRNYGAVSVETAREMASGIKALSGADIALSVTGIAGPTGGSDGKPVGTVCIGVAYGEKCVAQTFVFVGTRAQVRKQSVATAVSLAMAELPKPDKNSPKAKKVLGIPRKKKSK